jgi:prepilin-type N-terminal cleavage/methylation domain-containing protein
MKLTRAGFSLLEVIVSITIFSFVIVAMLEFTSRGFQSFSSLNDRTSTIAKARGAFDLLSRELREARSGDNGAYPLALTTDNEIIFYSNVDSSADVERVRYALVGSTIRRGIIKPVGSPASYPAINETTALLVDNVVNNGAIPFFAYYNGNYSGSQAALVAPVSPTAVRYVVLTARIDENANKKPEAVEIRTSSTLRNIKDNL